MKAFLKTTKGKIILGGAALLIILLLVLLITKVIGGEAGYRSISVSEISGSVMTENDGKKYEAYKNMRLADGYALTTDIASYTRMVLDSDKYVKLEEKSRALFEALGSDKQRKTAIRLENGTLTTEITAPLDENEDYIVNTPNAVLAVRGTFFKAVVRYDTNGDAYTDVYTYGGTVVCKRVMPDGSVVDEEVMITSGYKARIKMDEIITIYIEELIEEDEDNVDPIDIAEVPDVDIVDIYNASAHGHKMFKETSELWYEIIRRDIDLNDYHSVYDGGEILPYDENGSETETEEQTEAVTETVSETATDIPETSGEVTDISEEYDYNYDGTERYYPAETAAASNQGTDSGRETSPESRGESVTTARTESYTYTEPTEHTHSPYTEIFEEEPAVTEVTSVTTTETVSLETVGTEIELPVYTSTSHTATSLAERPVSSGTTVSETVTVPDVTTEPDVTSDTHSTSNMDNTSQTGSSAAGTVPTEPDVHVHNFAEYIPDGNATCTEDGTKTAVCSCGEKDTVIDVGSAGHKEAREVTEATFISEGNIRIYCSVCGENIGSVTLPRVPLYIDDGNLVISENGYSQGGGEEIPYTGDYNISQRSSSPASSTITVVNGNHNINFNGIDTSTDSDTFTVEKGAAVTISGGNKENKLSASGDNCYGLYSNGGSAAIKSGIFNFRGSYGIFGTADSVISVSGGYISASGSSDGIRTSGAFSVSGGNISAYGSYNGIWNNGEFTAVGGSLSAEGGSKDIKTYSDIRVTGGSVRAVQNIIDGKFVNSIGDELECEAFDVFPSETVRTFENSEGDKYVYGLAPEDKASDGYYYVWKPVDFTPEFDGTVYIDDGSVTITADGITQGGKTFTWAEDIVISQKDRSTAFDVRISIESGTHNIIFDGVNINSSKGNCVDISSGASAAVSGSVKENIIASAQERAINNNGTLRINSGAFKLSGGYCGIYNASQTSVNGGRISVSGGVCDIFSEESGTLTVSGGSIKSENSAIGGKITNPSGDELECKVYSEYTGNLTFKDSDGNEYTYKLDIGDSIDGGYYVWQPKGVVPEGVEVSEENFPDPVFREYVLENFDTDSDGYLSDEEITWVTEVDVSSKGVSSLKGVEHLTALETLNCYLNRITSLDVSQNTVLKWLNCGETQITSLDVSNNVDLITLQCYNTPITSLDLSNNTALTRLLCYKTKMTSLDVRRNNLILLYCYNTPITNLDVSNNTALKTLYCQNTNISHVDITNTAVASFNASDCEHPITAVNGVFDTKTIDGLDHTRISDLQGAVIDENGVMSGIKEGTNITYQYDCGREYLPIFTLVPDENSTFDTEEVPFDGTLDLSAGPVTITEDGFVQNGVTTPWTGDYIITQGDGSSAITIESGKHNIILEDASISASGYGLTIAEGAEVTLSGSGTISGISVSGTLTADDCNIISEGRCGIYISGSGTVYIDSGNFDLWGSNNGIFCEGKLDISGGSVSANGENYGIMNSSNGVVSVSGGSVSISGGEDDIYSSGKLEVTGGSVKAENGTLIGSIVNADGAELECVVFDTFPSEAERTFTNPDGSEYLYKLTEGDRAEDGKYYVWKPKAVPKGVEVNEENFPDTVFREYVSYWIDRNRDEYLSEKEIAEATQITVPEECVSVQGIEYLVNLEMLEIVDTQVTSFDISNNIDLRYLCVGSSEIDVIAPIASIDVSNNINLNELYIYDTQITTLDISNNTALTSLDCCNSPITSLDISSNTELIELDCTGIQIASLDLSSNTALTKLGCSNTPITSLDLSNNMALTALYCRNTQITSLNVSNNTTLMWLECNDTQIRSLNVSNNKSLRVLKCYNTPITSLDLSQNTALTSLDCYNTPITNLDVNNNTSLHTLWCYDTKISYVDISNNPNIISFSASDCKHPITVVNSKFDTKTIDGFDHTRVSNLQGAVMDENGVLSGITEGTNITYRYDCGQGKSETFTLVPDENSTFDTEIPEGVAISAENFPDTVFRNYVSENFDTDGNGILSEEEIAEATFVNVRQKSDTTDGGVTSLRGIEYLTALESLYCQYNANLIEIDVSKNTALTRLSCGSTSITSLNVSNNTSLTYLSCPRTQIMFLDVSNNTDLTELECCNTQITSLDVRNNRFLTILNCSDTQITSLDVRNNRSLTDLVCSNTKITSLDISNNTALIDLNCSNTQIPYVDIRNTSVSNFYAIGCTYYIPSGLSFDITTDFNFSGFNPNNVSNVQGAEFSKENGIFYNFTSDTITYYYDCGRGFTETFTLVMTGGMMYSDFAYDDTFEEDFPEQVGEDDVPPQNTEQDNGGENVSEDVPEQEVIGEDIPADEPEQSIPDMLFDAVITTAASAAANMVDITIFAADIVIYLISILIKLWR